MGSSGIAEKPHAVCVPYPAQGHINPMLKLAKLLYSKGFHITFVNSHYNHHRLLLSQGATALSGLPSFRFASIPDGLGPLPDNPNATQDIPSLCASTMFYCLPHFRRLLAQLNDSASSGVPPVTCIVSDGAMSWTLEAAEELGVPEAFLWTASACGFLGYAQYSKLVELGLTPFKDASYMTNGHLDTPINWLPSLGGIRLKDIPSFIRTTNPDDIMLNFVQRIIFHSKKASAILFNSFLPFESDSLNSLSSDFPPLFPVGPLPFLLSQFESEDTKSISSNLWVEDPKCLDWLDSKDLGTVVYVNFGSITVMTNEQLIEFAWGLANSKKPFLWITRPDLVTGDTAVLPPEFLAETESRGLIASWCNQEKVLSHPAIGGFLTHSGWNSTMESLCNGVAMICWPFFAEQQTNCWFCCEKWGIGMEIDNNVKRVEVEKQVRELMDGEKGKEMKRNAMEWKRLAEEATKATNGSSYMNLDKVIHDVLLSNYKQY